MEKLKFNKIEYMRSINTGEMPVRYEDFILGIPASFGNVSMLDLIDNIEKLDEKTSHNFLSRAKKDGYTKGQKMSEIVLRDYFVGLPPLISATSAGEQPTFYPVILPVYYYAEVTRRHLNFT